MRYKDYAIVARKLAPIADRMEEHDVYILSTRHIKDEEYEFHISAKNFQDFAKSVECKITVEKRPDYSSYDTEISFMYDGCKFFAILMKDEEDYKGNIFREL